MKKTEFILPVIVMGSMWGLMEILPVPVPVMCAAGILFLTAARRMVNVPGTSLAAGAIVCLLKTYAVNFHLCNLSGILSMAVSFEIFATVIWRNDLRTMSGTALRGALTCALALPLFVGAVLLFRHPYWVAGGWARIVDYAVTDTAPAMLLSLITAPLGLWAGKLLVELRQSPGRVIPAVYLSAVAVAWIAASVRFVERVF